MPLSNEEHKSFRDDVLCKNTESPRGTFQTPLHRQASLLEGGEKFETRLAASSRGWLTVDTGVEGT